MRGRAPALGAGRKRADAELTFRIKFFLKLLLTSYILMKVILYLTRVIADYFVSGVWKFV